MFKYSNTNKRYHTFDYYLKQKYGGKVFKVSLNAGFTCPNRDGNKGYRGCAFCSSLGAGENAGNVKDSLDLQFEKIKKIMESKWPDARSIAYFQAFSNTYAPVEELKEIYEPFANRNDILAIAIATRADCLDDEIIEYLSSLNKRKELWVEIGLQTWNDEIANSFNRGYPTSLFVDRVNALRRYNINVTVHIINGLKGESKKSMINTCKELNKLDIQGIKIHSLSILKDSIWGDEYLNNPFPLISREDYIDKEMVKRNVYQGDYYETNVSKSVEFYHEFIKDIANKEYVAIDATLGNGYDSLFLSPLYKKVYSFDIQELAIKRSKERLNNINNVELILDSHENTDKYVNHANLVIFNLGFLPGSDKKISTNSHSTIKAIGASYSILDNGGYIIIVGYSRHPGGAKEISEIEKYLDSHYEYDKKIFDYEQVYIVKK